MHRHAEIVNCMFSFLLTWSVVKCVKRNALDHTINWTYTYFKPHCNQTSGAKDQNDQRGMCFNTTWRKRNIRKLNLILTKFSSETIYDLDRKQEQIRKHYNIHATFITKQSQLRLSYFSPWIAYSVVMWV